VPTSLFSYVVDHDLGFAPNPEADYCTLVHCKFGGKGGHKNIVELARRGDWVMGTGGLGRDSAGHGRIIYFMQVTKKIPFKKYLSDARFRRRRDCKDFGDGNKFALISKRYFYFGRNALAVRVLPEPLQENIAKRGVGFRRDYPPGKLRKLVKWFARNYEMGMHGDPCGTKRDVAQVRKRKIPAEIAGSCKQRGSCARRSAATLGK
jgi:hypothetical protein